MMQLVSALILLNKERMIRIGGLFWLCCAAFGLGLLLAESAKRGIPVKRGWYPVAFLTGPVFLAFILPLWWFRWGRKPLK